MELPTSPQREFGECARFHLSDYGVYQELANWGIWPGLGAQDHPSAAAPPGYYSET